MEKPVLKSYLVGGEILSVVLGVVGTFTMTFGLKITKPAELEVIEEELGMNYPLNVV